MSHSLGLERCNVRPVFEPSIVARGRSGVGHREGLDGLATSPTQETPEEGQAENEKTHNPRSHPKRGCPGVRRTLR